MAFRAQRNSTYGLEGICVTCVNPSGPQQSFWGDWPVKCNRKPVCVILKSFVSLGHVTLNPSMLVAHHQFDVVKYSEIISDPRWFRRPSSKPVPLVTNISGEAGSRFRLRARRSLDFDVCGQLN
jgi:hypothetical protein